MKRKQKTDDTESDGGTSASCQSEGSKSEGSRVSFDPTPSDSESGQAVLS